MKMLKALLPALLFLNLFCNTAQSPVYWSSVEYIFESGPVSPKYQYSYTVNINKNNEGIFRYTYGTETLTYNFKVTKENTSGITKFISDLKLMEEAIPELPERKHPIGGSLRKLKIVEDMQNPDEDRPPKVYETPYFPDEEHLSALSRMYDFIYNLVPQNIRDEASSKRDAYINAN